MVRKIIQTGWMIVKRSWPAYVASFLMAVMACSSSPQKRSLASPVAVTMSEREIYLLRSQGDQIELIECEDFTTFEGAQGAQSCPAREGTKAIMIPKERFRKDLERALLLPEGYLASDRRLVERASEDFPDMSLKALISDLERRKQKLIEIFGTKFASQELKKEVRDLEAQINEYQLFEKDKAEYEKARADINGRIGSIIEHVVKGDQLLELGGAGNEPFAYHLLQSYIKLAQSPAAAAEREAEALVGKMVDISAHIRFPVTFQMGSPGTEAERGPNETQHPQTLTQAFYMGAHEVTQAVWFEVMGTDLSYFSEQKYCPESYDAQKGICPNHPVERVSWNYIVEEDGFLDRLNARLGLTGANRYRLPTEAEWEFAARAGTTTPFNLGDNITPAQVNYKGKYPYKGAAKGLYRAQTVAVGSLPNVNAWGLYDMHGNVWEWAQDGYKADYPQNPVADYVGPERADHRVLRGGSWGDYAEFCRSAGRNWNGPESGSSYFGFRLVRTK
jgi:formylglycine-generating enzyme required for sulfatase activity